MSSFKVTTTIETINSFGVPKKQSWTASKTSLTDIEWTNVQMTSGAIKFVWQPTVWADFRPSAFAVLTMVASGNLDVEMGVNFGAGTVEYNTVRLTKNVPFTLGADDAWANHAATTDAAFGGTLDIIDSLRVAEPSVGAVNLLMIMGT